MRTIAIMASAAGAFAAAFASAPRANAERMCRQVCDAGICQTYCFDENDHIFSDSRDKDFFFATVGRMFS
jgi:hypothetical protein